MKFRWAHLLGGLTIFLTVSASRLQANEVVRVPSVTSASDRSRFLSLSGKMRCEDLLTELPPTTVGEIINFADKKFERRGWSDEFMSERQSLAEKFPNSKYFYTEENGEITGTLAITYAEYGDHGSGGFESLPMEDCLGTILPRPFHPQRGRALITELRTYAMNKENHRASRLALFFSGLESVAFRYIFFPELWDLPVIYTYGDAISLKLYGGMGFENLTRKWGAQPIEHAGTRWWILGITPRNLRELINKEQKTHFPPTVSAGVMRAAQTQVLGSFEIDDPFVSYNPEGRYRKIKVRIFDHN